MGVAVGVDDAVAVGVALAVAVAVAVAVGVAVAVDVGVGVAAAPSVIVVFNHVASISKEPPKSSPTSSFVSWNSTSVTPTLPCGLHLISQM